MKKTSIKSNGPGIPKSVPSPGSVSAVGPSGAAPKPRLKNTRDYGKAEPETPTDAGVSPFGSVSGGF
jgi:hypothetical protein